MTNLMRSAFAEGRMRVFGGGFDRSFRVLLAAAVVAGGLLLAFRHPTLDLPVILVGIASMAIFVTMPFLAVTIFCTTVSLFAGWAGVAEDADPPMSTVLGACALTLVVVAAIVAAIVQVPLIGDQLRAMFA